MIYAELQYDQHYSEMHSSLVACLNATFTNIEHGLQGDSWIWIFEGDKKVAIDTFYSMKHQVKSDSSNYLFAGKVIETLANEFQLLIYTNPESEPHE